jgi:hypothetical protein
VSVGEELEQKEALGTAGGNATGTTAVEEAWESSGIANGTLHLRTATAVFTQRKWTQHMEGVFRLRSLNNSSAQQGASQVQ